jgi:antitoxin component of MazEF toxin-antitoxin module
MPSDTQIVDGIHLVKASGFGSPRVGVPEKLAEAAHVNNGAYVGVMVVGPCVIICPVANVTRDGMPEEMARKFEAAVKAWQKKP